MSTKSIGSTKFEKEADCLTITGYDLMSAAPFTVSVPFSLMKDIMIELEKTDKKEKKEGKKWI